MKLKDFKKGCNQLLSETFESKYPIYGTETTDGYKRPAFFTELLPRTWQRKNVNVVEIGLTYKLTFLETTHNEALCLDIVDAVQSAFGWTVKAAGKTWLCDSIDYDFIDTSNDVLQVTIDFANVRIVNTKAVTGDLIEKVFLDLEIYSPSHDLMAKDEYEITKKGD